MVINPIVGFYIPIIRIPIKGGMTIPNIATFDHGTVGDGKFCDQNPWQKLGWVKSVISTTVSENLFILGESVGLLKQQ